MGLLHLAYGDVTGDKRSRTRARINVPQHPLWERWEHRVVEIALKYLGKNSQHITGIREGKVLSVRVWSSATHRRYNSVTLKERSLGLEYRVGHFRRLRIMA
jgi:hypothetical protein